MFSTITPVLGCGSITCFSINRKNNVTLTITDAYYTDLDNDEVFDIVSFFELSFSSFHRLRYTVKINVYLILPSGYEFSYKWIIGTKQSKYFGQIDFYDHALESGDYILFFKIKLFTGGVTTGVVGYEFDPPGGSGGGDPLAMLR
ncbi:MAG: hypothetical protein ACFFB5_11290 [Promethearchaeota archaeon]